MGVGQPYCLKLIVNLINSYCFEVDQFCDDFKMFKS
jgi:hypothetical protein